MLHVTADVAMLLLVYSHISSTAFQTKLAMYKCKGGIFKALMVEPSLILDIVISVAQAAGRFSICLAGL